MLRRSLLTTLPLVILAACQQQSANGAAPAVPTMTPAQIVSTAQGVANGLAGALPQILLLPAVKADAKATATIRKVAAGVTQAQAALNALASNLPTAQQGAVTLTTVWGYLNAAVAAAEAIPGLPPNIQTILVSAGIGLPIVETFINTTLGTALSSVNKT